MLVRTLLESKPKNVVTATTGTTIDAAMDMMISNNIGCLPVVEDDGKLIGIVSDKDIFRKIHETKGDYHNLKVSDVMTTDLIVGLPDDDIEYIAGVMDNNWIRHVPIVEGDHIIGLVSIGDVIRIQSSRHEIENRYLKLYMDGMGSRDRSADA
jgi:CBS domain-containing protein